MTLWTLISQKGKSADALGVSQIRDFMVINGIKASQKNSDLQGAKLPQNRHLQLKIAKCFRSHGGDCRYTVMQITMHHLMYLATVTS